MQEGIVEDADKQAVIRVLIDTFNEMQASIAQQYGDNVTYLDFRGFTQRDYWYDEIHPNSEGFLSISEKYKAAIESADLILCLTDITEGLTPLDKDGKPLEYT